MTDYDDDVVEAGQQFNIGGLWMTKLELVEYLAALLTQEVEDDLRNST